MEKEFNLSEKMKELRWDEEDIGRLQIPFQDVKEFIKRLKEFAESRAKTMQLNMNNKRLAGKSSCSLAITEISNILTILDKLAGDKLI